MKSARWAIATAAAVLLAAAARASDCTAARRDLRPCRAAGRRLYEEPRSAADDGDGYAETDGGGGREADGPSADETAAAADDDDDDDYPQPPRRGVRRLPPQMYEKNFAGPTAAGPGNGPRALLNNALLNGGTVELPTYVNVPVTIRCRFAPSRDGADDKFVETVIEAVYPGHAGAPPPPPDSHASHIVRQLMGSVDGWRGVVDKSTRPVRRVVETGLFGWPRARSPDGGHPLDGAARQDEPRFGDGRDRRGRRPHAEDAVVGGQIAARRLAAEQHRPWYRGSRPNAAVDRRSWFFDERRPAVREHRNELFGEPARAVDGRQPDGRRGQAGRVDVIPDEPSRETAAEERADAGETDQERAADDRTAGDAVAGYSRRAANRAEEEEEEVDDRVLSGTGDEAPSDELEQPAVTTESGTATSAKSDYAMITGTAPMRTYTEEAMTDSYE